MMNNIPIRNVREHADPLSPQMDELCSLEPDELCSLDRDYLRLGAAGWPVGEDRADQQTGGQTRLVTEQIGADDHCDDEHQRPAHGLRHGGLEPCRPGQDQDRAGDAGADPHYGVEEELSDLVAGLRMPGNHGVEHDDAQRRADRVGQRALPLQDES